jgi:hypothetical protein
LSIAKALNEAKPYSQIRRKCPVGALSKEDQKAIVTARERDVAYTTIAEVLRENDVNLHETTIGRHVKGQCGCVKA